MSSTAELLHPPLLSHTAPAVAEGLSFVAHLDHIRSYCVAAGFDTSLRQVYDRHVVYYFRHTSCHGCRRTGLLCEEEICPFCIYEYVLEPPVFQDEAACALVKNFDLETYARFMFCWFCAEKTSDFMRPIVWHALHCTVDEDEDIACDNCGDGLQPTFV